MEEMHGEKFPRDTEDLNYVRGLQMAKQVTHVQCQILMFLFSLRNKSNCNCPTERHDASAEDRSF